jgi:hypothetical protein
MERALEFRRQPGTDSHGSDFKNHEMASLPSSPGTPRAHVATIQVNAFFKKYRADPGG